MSETVDEVDPLDAAMDRLSRLDITSTVPQARTGDVFRVWQFARAHRRRLLVAYDSDALLRDLAEHGVTCDNEGDQGWVDSTADEIMRALLAAGWTPPPTNT